jgi:hypothetical protein
MKLLTSPFLLLAFVIQTHVNREWVEKIGDPLNLEWSTSINGIDNRIIHVGNTVVSGQGANVSTTVYHNDGSLDWQSDYNTSGQSNDYGIAVIFDQNENVYVLGTTDNETTTNYDLLLLKYSPSGALIWSQTYNSNYNLKDIGTDLIIDDAEQYIYICASSESTTGNYDFLTLKYSESGVFQWSERYDYNNLPEIPVGIDFDDNGDVFVTGASGSTIARWDYSIVKYTVGGTYLGDERIAMPGIGFDQALAFARDSLNNIYITGRSSTDGVNYDIKTIKMDQAYGIQWTQVYDYSGKVDVGSTIQVDSLGNVYVGGFVTRSDNVKDMFVIKYDSNGNILYEQNFSGEDSSEDAFIKASDISKNGEFYFLGQEVDHYGKEQCVISKMKTDGTKQWLKKIGGDHGKKPIAINLAKNGSIYVSVASGDIDYKDEIFKYTEFEQGSNVIYNNLVPVCKDNELIVRFKNDALNTDAIDNKIGDRIVEYESLDYYLMPDAMESFNEAMARVCEGEFDLKNPNPCNVMAVKIFKQLRTTDTTTTSRMGETIRIPDFWTTLLLVFPDQINLGDAYVALDNNAKDIIAYSEPNKFVSTLSAPNDNYYQNQHSLFSNSYPDAHINMEEAWEVYPKAGERFIKCGVFDQGINWKHEDFGYNGSDTLTSKVRGGWDFDNTQSIFTTTVTDYGHGTPCAGIIGAIRNNSMGIAGIAGGNYQGNDSPDKGVSLYALKIMNDTLFGNPIQNVYDAIVSSSIDDTLDYTFGLNIASNSWRVQEEDPNWYIDTNLTLIREATRFANRAKVTFVASRGNEGNMKAVYPATIDDDWILSVGGSGDNGRRKTKFNGAPQGQSSSSSYGQDMDFIAPAATGLIVTTKAWATSTGNWYQNFSMTSAAAPHVAGTVALLQSYLNSSMPAYENLAPEDCEHILQLTAVQRNINIVGYSDSTGWGLIDAGAAFRLIEKPWNTVHHFGTQGVIPFEGAYSVEALGSTIELREQLQNYDNQWFDKGQYDVNVYRYDATVYHGSEIASIDTLVAYWARPSSSEVLEPVYNDSLLPRERVQIDYLDRDSCVMHGYVYELLDNSGSSIGWLPKDTLSWSPHLEYTVLTRDSTAPVANVDKQEIFNEEIMLYPNPTSNAHTLVVNGFEQKNLIVELFDIQGRRLETIYNGVAGKKQTFEINVSHLNSGMYFYSIKSEGIHKSIRFIKQ